MPANIEWLDEALDDLQTISDYITTTSPAAAAKYTDSILAACEKLVEFPESGRQYNRDYRALVVRNHMVFYRYDRSSNTVSIATILDGRRNIASLLDGEA
jgi:plasmid stabilization system protein ParE